MTCLAALQILRLAHKPCKHLSGLCKGKVKWDPEGGYIPRGFVGANGEPDEVKVVLVTAEPGDPADGERYTNDHRQMADQHIAFYEEYLVAQSLRRHGTSAPFHRNLVTILGLLWPEIPIEAQLKRTWITDAVLCSAHVSGGRIQAQVERMCADTYLKPQLSLFQSAFVIALGGKAQRRLRRCGIRFNAMAEHPSAWASSKRNESWQLAAAAFHVWYGKRPRSPTIL